ncbi:MAG: riboflavin synthase, partial [Kiritimatiellaeota bacterium]|nr:riboflavin synthase [Kiritimatiellota bacterium]
VQGVCLTVAQLCHDGFEADVLDETLERTTLGTLRMNAPVNLERALRLSDRLGGHLVSGHVDGRGTVSAKFPRGRDTVLRIACDGALLRYVIHKGSIAIDGVSLTVTAVTADAFEVNLIPTTLADTTLGACALDAPVNLETDLVAKYIERFTRHAAARPLSLETLTAAGFL